MTLRQREPRERDPDFLGWLAKLPCAACLCVGVFTRGVQCAHLRIGSVAHGKSPTGMSEKPGDRWCVPLCAPHHLGDKRKVRLGQHEGNELAFYAELGINPFDLCLALSDAYDHNRSGSEVVARFAAHARKAMGAQR
jgi:hypothetical protein